MKGSQFPDGGQGQTDDYALGVRGAGNIKLKLLQLFAPAWGQSWTNAAGDGQIPVGVRGSLAAIGGGLDTHLSNNAIWTAGAWRYVQAGPAVNYYQSAGLHVFRAAAPGAAGAAITWSQVITISSSGVGLNSGALNFPATQIASSDPNTLDDYEEGQSVVTLHGSTSDPTTPVTATLTYVKIGKKYDYSATFANVNTAGAAGNITISGLPFISSVVSVGNLMVYGLATFASGTPLGYLGPGNSAIDVYCMISNASWATVTHNAGAGRYMHMTGTVIV